MSAVNVYTGRALYAKDQTFYDAFASIDGEVYPDIKNNYTSITEESVAVQRKIDINFYYDKASKNSVLTAPSTNRSGVVLTVNNQTLFKRLNGLETLKIEEVSAAQLIALTTDAEIFKEGNTQINNLKVGDVIGFITDLNAVHSLKTGILKVTGLHPSSVDRYDGVSYVLECDVVVQQ